MSTLLATVTVEGARIAALPAGHLDAPVPGMDGWDVQRVVRHLGRVHRWVTGLLGAPADADPAAVSAAAPSLPRGPGCLDAYADALAEMLDSFGAAEPTRAVASFAGPADVAFWARRQAHEATVHRVDAQDAVHTAGGPAPDALDAAVAADGVAEWAGVFASTYRLPDDAPLRGRSIGLVATDGDDADAVVGSWSLRYDAQGNGSVDTTHDVGARDVTLSGPAGTLLLTLWRRRPLDQVTVTGDGTVAEALVATIRV